MTNERHDPLKQLDPTLAAELARYTNPTTTASSDHRSKATYDLRPDTIAQIKTIATELGVPIYSVAQKFLDYALAEYQAGRLELRRRAVVTTWKLE